MDYALIFTSSTKFKSKTVRKFSSIFLATSLLFLGKVSAQQPCGTDAKYWQLVKEHPEMEVLKQEFEDQIAQAIKKGLPGTYNKTTAASDTVYYDVPVVIHLVHDYGPEYLNDDDIYDAVKYWSVVYEGRNPDTNSVIAPFKPYIGNARIRLHLATIDPNGKPTKGVTRHQHYSTLVATDDAKLGYWPNNKYLNIWFIRSFGAGGPAAYAYYPSSAASMPYYDGIISLYNYINIDKVIPHEIGHVLNLAHTWGSTNNPDVACGDDNVDDTPPTKGHNPVGCVTSALYDVTCATGYTRRYTDIRGADSIVNYPDTVNSQNIMDYTYCQRMFTIGQTVRMRTALTSSVAGRSNLITPSNLNATGALMPTPDLKPIAEYSVERATGIGVITDPRTRFLAFNHTSNFTFRNRSWNDTISSIQWLFSNNAATPTSTSVTGVNNTFRTPGWVTTTVIATSNAGSDTLIDPQSVYAADTTAINNIAYFQEFSNAAAISNWPMINYYNNQYKWQMYKGASWGGDSSCIRYRSRDTTNKLVATPYGDVDDFFTPAFNLSNVPTNYYLNFRYSGAKSPGTRWSTVGDSMEVQVSTTGGMRWAKLAGFNTAALATAGTVSAEYKPTTAAQWRAFSVNIPAAYRGPQTFFRFRYYPGEIGNNFYLDNFHTYPYPVEVEEHIKSNNLVTVFPNPVTGGACQLICNTGNSGIVHVIIRDMTGRTVMEEDLIGMPNSIKEATFDRNVLNNAGLYIITAIIDGNATTAKIVVY